MSKLSEEEIKSLAEELAKEIQEAGGLETYYDGMYGEGAFKKDAARYVAGLCPTHETIQ